MEKESDRDLRHPGEKDQRVEAGEEERGKIMDGKKEGTVRDNYGDERRGKRR